MSAFHPDKTSNASRAEQAVVNLKKDDLYETDAFVLNRSLRLNPDCIVGLTKVVGHYDIAATLIHLHNE